VEWRAVLARIGLAFHPRTWRRAAGWLRHRHAVRVWRVGAVVAAGIAGGWAGLAVGGQVLTPIGPADVVLAVGPSWRGETVINIAPLGKLAFDTHAAPLRFEATIAEIRLTAAEEMVQNPESIHRLGASIVADVKQGAVMLAWRAVLASVGTAALVCLLLFRSWVRALVGALTALVMLATAGGVTYFTFNPGAIAEPRYTGLLAGAPQVVGSVEDVINHFSEYQAQLAGLVGNVSQLYQVTSTLPVYEEDAATIRVLHVSDLHLNPAAWEVINSLVEQFQVAVVVDSGDISDRGSAAEDVFMDQIADLDVPYVWVRGNHDSMGTQRAVAAQPNAIVLDDDIVEVAGLRFYGAGDPRFTADKALDNPTDAEVAAIGARQARSIADADPPVDVAVLHDPLQGEAFSGVVPLVLCGHGHERWTEIRESGTRIFAQGSTGGAGLRGLEHDEPTPYQASVLYFDAETKRLQAWDDITLGGLGLTSVQIERHIESDPDREITPVETVAPSLDTTPPTLLPPESPNLELSPPASAVPR
jgi:predicted phosphodiesterase